jgi:hypothetical protein
LFSHGYLSSICALSDNVFSACRAAKHGDVDTAVKRLFEENGADFFG